MKITKGIVAVEEVFTRNGTDSFLKVTVPKGESVCNITTRNMERAEGNAKVVAEAINVANECGKTPRELLRERNEFFDMAVEAIALLNSNGISNKLNKRFKDFIMGEQPHSQS